MNKNTRLWLIVGLSWGMAGGALAEAPATQAAGTTTVKGKVAVTASQDAQVTAATLTAEDGTVYNLVMDPAGEDLARVMFGQPAQILATISEKAGQKWLTVRGFPTETASAAHELWRRSRCNACALQKGTQYAAEPKDLKGAQPVTGLQYPYKQQFRSISRDDKYLWLATDRRIDQVDLATGQLVKTYDRSIGLPEQPILEIASDGKTLWILLRGSVAALPIGQDKVIPQADIRGQFGVLCRDGSAMWVLTDNETCRYAAPDQPPQTFPAIPTGKRMAGEIDKGLLLLTWKRDTGSYLTQPVVLGDKLFVSSYGDVYELDQGTWRKLAEGAGQIAVSKDRLWVLTSGSLVEYDPQTKTKKTYIPPDINDGRFTGLVVTATDAWVTSEPIATPKGDQYAGGGIGRLNLATKEWQAWKKIDGLDATHAVVQAGPDGTVWVATHQGSYQTLAAHPGMTYVTKILFAATGFGLHRWNGASGKWLTLPLAYTNVEKRFICGQDGQGGNAEIGPQSLERLCVGKEAIFAADQLRPVGSFSGYWPCVNQVATRSADEAWSAQFQHHPEALNLQGEQPLVLNISNKGEMILEAVGHDNILDLFIQDGRFWAVTESCAARYDPAKKTWQKAVELGFNFYWRPTAILDEGEDVFIGSDRGLISRLNLKTGRCEIIGGLKDRAITGLARKDGKLVVLGGQAPLGLLPVQLQETSNLVDADAASWDGKTWQAIKIPETREVILTTQPSPAWQFKPIGEPPKQRPFLRDQMIGNMLWGPGADGAIAPRYYLKEVYAPRLLGFSPDKQRMWFSVFGGLLRVDLTSEEKTK